MAIGDGDVGTAVVLADGPDGLWLSAEATSAPPPRDWRLLYEEERARAETRAEELRWAEVSARCDAGSWRSRFEASRRKLRVVVEETREARRAAKDALWLRSEVGRLHDLLRQAGVDASKRSTVMALRMEVARLRKAVPALEAREHEIRQLRKVLLKADTDNDALRRQLHEILRIHGELSRLRDRQDTVRSLSGEVAGLREALRRSRRQKATIGSLSREVARLRKAVQASKTRRERSQAQLAELRAIRKSLSGTDTELRKALGRSRRQKATIGSLIREKARLGKTVKAAQRRIGKLEARLAKLRATRTVLSKALFGRKSERQETPRSGRRRGRQPGARGHGRTQRPGLEERTQEHNPPSDARMCCGCGSPYAANGAEQSTLVEIEVRAHRRVIRRPRWRRTCECASSPVEVSAPPVPRLFANTPYGTSVWSRFLFEHYACLRPLHRVGAWLSDQGLPVSPGTLAGSVPRFVPLFEPVADAILAHHNSASLRHADETSWRVQGLRETGRSSRAWLWTSAANDAVYFHIDPSRSAEAAHKLFAEARPSTVIVCDRYSAYKRLARLLEGRVTLSFCWSHMRRDFIECAAGQLRLTGWCREWTRRIASIYRLNKARPAHYDSGLERQSPEFDAARDALNEALGSLFANAERELARLPPGAREGRALRSLVNHREGLSVFVDRPRVPLDNNLAERLLRGPVIGRRLSFGSDSETGARFTALMYSVVGTLTLNGIDVLRWLTAWLATCAHNGGRPPGDLSPWLPWSMSEERRRDPMAPV